MSLRKVLGDVRRCAICAYARRSVSWEPRAPTISFTFDDFPRSAYETGGKILRRHGVQGTYYVAASLAASTNDLGEQFHPEDLTNLVRDGHELASHTYSHISARRTALCDFRVDVVKGMTALQELSHEVSTNFAYPYGEATFASKPDIGSMMQSCRGTIHGLNEGKIDLNLLRANPLYGGTEIVVAARQLIETNQKKKAWLIFYTHDVRMNPSRYGCTPEAFESIVKMAVASGSRVLTVEQVVCELGIPGGPSRG